MEGCCHAPVSTEDKGPVGSPCVSPTAQWGHCSASTYVGEQMNRRAGMKEKSWVPGWRATPHITRGAVGALRAEEGEESRRAL